MRLANDDIIAELKTRLDKEKSMKRRVQLKQMIDLLKQL
ncbi:Uncharacterised protein [uncultured archaeon]|nr:Uncharacterised protein [uncultured archaeon]